MSDGLDRRGSEPCVEDSVVLETAGHSHDVLLRLNELRQERTLTDATLCVGSSEFPCHRAVLAVSSPYFKAMFSNDLRESKEARVEFQEVSPAVLLRIIEYAYTGRVEVTVDNAQDLLAAGSLFQYPSIVEVCSEFLLKHLHPSNCLGIEHFAHLHSCHALEEAAHSYTLDNFSAVVAEGDEFRQLPLERLLTYIASDLIDVRSEEAVYGAALAWIEAAPRRAQHYCTILEHVRLATLTHSFLHQELSSSPHLAACDACRQRVEAARRDEATVTATTTPEVAGGQPAGRRRSVQQADIGDSLMPRPSTVAREVLVVVGGMSSLNLLLTSVEMFDPHKDKWLPLPDLPQPISWFSTAALNNDIYVTGGIRDGHIVASVWRFEASSRRWSPAATMLSPRARHASAVYKGRLYVVGGIDLAAAGSSNLVSVERIDVYDAASDAWSEAGAAPVPRKQSRLASYKHTLLEVGGTKGGAPEDTMETYVVDGGCVMYSGEQYKLPYSLQFSQLSLIAGCLYIVWEDSRRLISLSPDRRTFRRLADPAHAHVHGGSGALAGRLYIAGGLEDGAATRVVERYDPATDAWQPVKGMRTARACHGAVSIKMC